MRRSILTAAVLLVWGSAMAVEEPRFEVVRGYEDFELRRYAPFVVAETEVEGAFENAGNAGFRVLFRYIDRGNDRSESISLTAPVTQRAAQGKTVVGFVMPESYTLDTLPAPADARIRMREMPERLVAAMRYSGTWVDKAIDAETKTLDAEDAHAYIKGLGTEDRALVPCPCRTRTEKLDIRECKDKFPVGACIFIGKTAAHFMDIGLGRKVTKEKAIEYLDHMVDLGLIPTTDNYIDDPHMIMCLCCG